MASDRTGELELVGESEGHAWPPRLGDQPIFPPVPKEDYAVRIAWDKNVETSGIGHVTRCEVRKDFLDEFDVHQVGGNTILEH
ncbi:hypothetical protein [Curtobacterium sp. RRHDQ10]|uniref:hypothetical protein n=1 Tax=Curtobacterium phyllosphaerae TaxID=3413379 RepID=UPI003BEF8F4C